MQKLFVAICISVLTAATAMAYSTQDGEMAKKTEKKTVKKVAPGTDSEIQKCISEKLANSEKLKSQGFNVTVSDGSATLTGNAANPGSKGGATGIAKSCGAKSVSNNITVPPGSGPKRKTEAKEEKKN
jgi:osmotically-inducible protein OsmY